MSRDIGSITSGQLSADLVRPFFAVKMEFDSGELNLWTGLGTATFGGDDYVGTGSFLTISDVEETVEIAARGATLSLTGIPSEAVSLALVEPYSGRLAYIYFGLFDTSTGVASDLVEVFTGYMDTMNIEESGDTSSIALTIENKLIDLERPRVARFTSAYQKSIYPDDKGLDFIESLQDKQIRWGR